MFPWLPPVNSTPPARLPRARARCIGADRVADHPVASCAGTLHPYAGPAVAADQVALTWRLPAHNVSAGGAADCHAVERIRDVACAGHIGANGVAQHAVAGRPKALDQDAGAPIPADDVAHTGLLTAHHVVVYAEADMDPELPVAQRPRAGHVGADVVAQHPIGRGAVACVVLTPAQVHADLAVAADEVTFPRAFSPIRLSLAPLPMTTPSFALGTAAVPFAFVPI